MLVNPGDLSTSLPGPWRLLDAINNRDCKFARLSPLELKQRCEELQKKQKKGTAPVKTRKPRTDRGIKRSHRKANKQGEGDDNNDEKEEEEEEEGRSHKRQKSTEIVPTQTNDWAWALYIFYRNFI